MDSMIPIIGLTLRALTRSRRLIVVALLLLIPALLALVFRLSSGDVTGDRFALRLFGLLALPLLLPLTSLILATSALGGELDDKTLPYLTLKPIARLSVVAAKYVATALVCAALVEVALVAMYVVGAAGAIQGQTLTALLLAGLAGCLAYTAVFLPLGLFLPRQGLIVGILYVVIWEGIAAGFSTGLATLSVRRYVEGTLHMGLGASPLATLAPSSLSGATSLLVIGGIVLLGVLVCTWRLRTLEMP
ncbi:MAG TPA: ABC transporter permease [Ktedonobacterales bacterium]